MKHVYTCFFSDNHKLKLHIYICRILEMVKKILIFSFTKSDNIIYLIVISCNLFARESLLSNMVFHLTSLSLSPLSFLCHPPPLSVISPICPLSLISPISALSPLSLCLSYLYPLSRLSFSSLASIPFPSLLPLSLPSLSLSYISSLSPRFLHYHPSLTPLSPLSPL